MATTTVRFEPVYAGLRLLQGQADTAATRPTYALPTLIRIYSDGRLVGTDLTTLQLVVNSATGGGCGLPHTLLRELNPARSIASFRGPDAQSGPNPAAFV